jgi:hypothetical protein
MLSRIAESDYAELAAIVLDAAGSRCRKEDVEPHANAVLRAIYHVLERKIDCDPDAFSSADTGSLFTGIPVVRLGRSQPQGIDATEMEQLRRVGLDVLILLSRTALDEGVAAIAKFGVWYISQGDVDPRAATPPGFWEVYFAWPANSIELRVARDGVARVVARCVSGTNQLSIKLNRSNIYWKALSLIPRKLEELYREGPGALDDAGRDSGQGRIGCITACTGSPTNAQMALHILRNVTRRLKERLSRTLTLEQWILLCHAGKGPSTAVSAFHKLVPPKDRYWADPHVLQRGDHYYVFVEEYPFSSCKGYISVLELDSNGRHLGTRKVLEREYHLSYPFVFEHDGALFMVPETSANRTVELYRCVEFPDRWTFVRNLLEDVFAVDSTLLHHAGKWWLFANVVENAGASPSEELFLFHAESLDGTWTPHLLNPIVSDVTRSRPAGPILRQNGKLYRVAQNCSVRYGYGIKINEITALSEDCYEERLVHSIEPNWDKKIVATHTLSYADGLTVIDCLQPRLRFR